MPANRDYAERARVIVARRTRYDSASKTNVVEHNVPVSITSAPVCCLADIPIAHLAYHSARYGKFALGFHRDSIVSAGFNPVLYTLEDTHVIRSMYKGLTSLRAIDMSTIESAAMDIAIEAMDFPDSGIDSDASDIASEANIIEDRIGAAIRSVQRLLAFTKTFSKSEFGTIYCEREWRSVKLFKFDADDIAMIVMPRSVGSRHYFEKFVSDAAKRCRLPRSVPIVPWEDLIEY